MVRFQSIEESLRKIKVLAEILNKRAVYTCIIAACVAPGLFLAGKISILYKDRHPVILESCSMVFQVTSTQDTLAETTMETGPLKGPYIGSRSSNKFHHESCPSARLIKEGNRVYFSNKETALSNGYVPAGNCDM
jgi:hypothetical protein